MKKAGGLVALIGAIFGVLAAAMTLFVGGAGHALKAEGAHTVVSLGWWGLALSFVCIALGAAAMQSNSRMPGWLLIVASIAGAILGGTIVAICMALVLVGGILCVIARRQVATPTA
jgi:hypothetical protein